jgi:small subunit ribosomal protein S8
MSMSDPIADLLTRIRNAIAAKHTKFSCPASQMKEGVLTVLKDEGYIRDFKLNAPEEGHKSLEVELKFNNGTSVISELTRISKPGRRVYKASKDLEKVHGGLGIYILSTSKGVIADHQARTLNVGGEIICKIF